MTRRVALGSVEAIPTDQCVGAADGLVAVVRVGSDIRAYRNRCLHQDAPLAGGWVRRGVLSCPLHFWRYDVSTGRLRDTERCLDRFEVEIVDGQAYVMVPDEPAPISLRDQLLARAAGYDRETEYRRAVAANQPDQPATDHPTPESP